MAGYAQEAIWVSEFMFMTFVDFSHTAALIFMECETVHSLSMLAFFFAPSSSSSSNISITRAVFLLA
jgi:hypothetical protein